MARVVIKLLNVTKEAWTKRSAVRILTARFHLLRGAATKQYGCCSLPDREASSALPLRNHL
jgi:hypothetical protein